MESKKNTYKAVVNNKGAISFKNPNKVTQVDKRELEYQKEKEHNESIINSFMSDFKSLLKKHELQLRFSTTYNCDDEPDGTEIHFKTNVSIYYDKDFMEIMKELDDRY